MRGQYAHNPGFWINVSGPSGGWQGYQSHGPKQDNVATRFDGAGYRTGLFGIDDGFSKVRLCGVL